VVLDSYSCRNMESLFLLFAAAALGPPAPSAPAGAAESEKKWYAPPSLAADRRGLSKQHLTSPTLLVRATLPLPTLGARRGLPNATAPRRVRGPTPRRGAWAAPC
jgi:hypothetical protein